jgi:surface antigen
VGRTWRTRILVAGILLIAAIPAFGVFSQAILVSPAQASISSSTNRAPNYSNWSPSIATNYPCPVTPSYACAQGGYNETTVDSSGWPWTDYGGSNASDNSYGPHNSTLYAAFRLEQLGVPNTGDLGNASQWAVNAAKIPGVVVNQTPSVGAIAQWNDDSAGNGSDGHVAYVESVDQGGTGVTISEDNFVPEKSYVVPGGYTAEIHITSGSSVWPANFVHFMGTTVVAPGNGQTVSGTTLFDASALNASTVQLYLYGGSYGFLGKSLCTATPTLFGWLCFWNSTSVANGSYALVSKASSGTASILSASVGISVNNGGTLQVTPSSGLTNGSIVAISGVVPVGDELGGLMECNNDPNQPTILINGQAGTDTPVSCSNPLNFLITSQPNGSLASTSFTIGEGVQGPAWIGTDSAGGNAATDAASYPCPPTSAQLAAGYACDISWLGNAQDRAQSGGITFTTLPPFHVTPDSGLSNGSVVTVSGVVPQANELGGLMECNNDPYQPSIPFNGIYGIFIPVSCTDPDNYLVASGSNGNLAPTSFTIGAGVLGPPGPGNDGSGGNAATDAANFPCPPTPAQLAAGYSCDISFLGGTSYDRAIVANITVAGQ